MSRAGADYGEESGVWGLFRKGIRSIAGEVLKRLDGLVSVVTPTFNSATVVERGVLSVARQSVRVLEHIIIDDGSSDGTDEILYEIERRFSHVKVVRQKNNRGAGVARNVGIEVAQGRYIAFLDSDDIWLPDKLLKQVGYMEDNNVIFSYGDYCEVDVLRRKAEKLKAMPSRLRYEDFLRGCPIGCLTVAYNQEALGKMFMPPVRRGQDWGLWLALAKKAGEARRYEGVEAVYFSRPNSLSKNKIRKIQDIYKIYRDYEGCGRLSASWFLGLHMLSKVFP